LNALKQHVAQPSALLGIRWAGGSQRAHNCASYGDHWRHVASSTVTWLLLHLPWALWVPASVQLKCKAALQQGAYFWQAPVKEL
jgi:hypothetical protein